MMGELTVNPDPSLNVAPATVKIARHEGGGIAVIAHQTEGRLNGPYHAFWEDGSPKASGLYRDGVKHGPWVYYPQRGSAALTHQYNDGVLVNAWRASWPTPTQ